MLVLLSPLSYSNNLSLLFFFCQFYWLKKKNNRVYVVAQWAIVLAQRALWPELNPWNLGKTLHAVVGICNPRTPWYGKGDRRIGKPWASWLGVCSVVAETREPALIRWKVRTHFQKLPWLPHRRHSTHTLLILLFFFLLCFYFHCNYDLFLKIRFLCLTSLTVLELAQ